MKKPFLYLLIMPIVLSSTLLTSTETQHFPKHHVNWQPVCDHSASMSVVQFDNAYEHVKAFGTKWKAILQNTEGSLPPDTPTCAFRFHINDMIDAFGITGSFERQTDRIRAYMGVDPVSNRTHLYFVPIKKNENGRFVDAPFKCDNNYYVLDLTTPCPKTCGHVNGRLREAFNEGLEE